MAEDSSGGSVVNCQIDRSLLLPRPGGWEEHVGAHCDGLLLLDYLCGSIVSRSTRDKGLRDDPGYGDGGS